MAAILTTICEEVVKTAAICKLGPGAHACQAALCAFAPAGLVFALAPARPRPFAPAGDGDSVFGTPFPCSPSTRTYMFGHIFCSCGSAVAALAMAAGWTVGRAWASRFSAPVKRYEHLTGAMTKRGRLASDSLMKMRKTRKSRS